MDGKAMSLAWDEWLKSEEGVRCTSGAAEGQYLANRLWRAFMAGMLASATPQPALESPVQQPKEGA